MNRQVEVSRTQFNDPHAIAVLIKTIKDRYNLKFHQNIKPSQCDDMNKRSSKLTMDTALNYLNKSQDGTNLKRIYFAGSELLDIFAKAIDLASWDAFKKTIKTVTEGIPTNPAKGSKALEAHREYGEKYYNKWRVEIGNAIGVELAEYEKVATKDEVLKARGATPVRAEDFQMRKPFFVGEERRKGLEEQALYLVNPEKPLAIIGMAGIGKTYFAKNLVEQQQVIEAYGKNRFVIYCEAEITYGFFLSKLCEILQIQRTADRASLEKLVADHLSRLPGSKLIVFDNFDTCYDNYFGEAKAFLNILHRLATVVYTMRSHFGPQQLDCVSYRIPKMSETEAITLFHYHSNDKFKHGDENLDHIRYLVGNDAAGYLPLALKLIAKQAETMISIADLYEEWKERRLEIMEIEGAEKDKDSSVRLSISFSFHSSRLLQEDRSLLKALCFFPKPIAKFRELMRKNVNNGFNMFNRLMGVALIEESPNGDLDIHPTIREYMNEQGQDPQPYLEILIEFYLDLTIQYAPRLLIPAWKRHPDEIEFFFSQVKNMSQAITLSNPLPDVEPSEKLRAAVDAYFIYLQKTY